MILRRHALILWVVCLLSGMTWQAAVAEEETVILLRSVNDAHTQPLTKTVGDETYPVLEEIPATDPLVIQARSWLNKTLTRQNLALGMLAKRYVKRQGPLYLHLQAGGNFPRTGFFLHTSGLLQDKTQIIYMSIAPNARFMTLTLPHENGHIMMQNLMFDAFNKLKGWPQGMLPHTITAETSFLTAFSEGYGEHFETRAGDMANQDELLQQTFRRDPPGYQAKEFKQQDYFFEVSDFLNYAQTYKRYSYVKANLFVFRKPNTASRTELNHRPTAADLLQEWMDPSLDYSTLKTGQEMLASEGVCATLFYRLVTNPELQQTMLAEPYLQRFGVARAAVRPWQVPYLKLFVVMAALTERDLAGTPVISRLIQGWGELFPEDQQTVFALFLETTKYVTVAAKNRELYHRLFRASSTLDQPALADILPKAQLLRQQTLAESLKNPGLLAKGVGPELWLSFPTVTLALPALGIQDLPLRIDLNKATYWQLLAIPGIQSQEAQQLWQAREEQGYFTDLQSLPVTDNLKQKLLAAAH